jgi:HD-GYP domain-containing protein (c-di-GMP phosphodiesterase class II)
MRLKINEIIISVGVLLLIISQFTGMYYTFDEHNRYQRTDGYIISAVIPLIVWLIAVTIVVQYRKSFGRMMLITLLVFASVPLLAAFVQLFFYGISITNLAIAALTVALRLVEIIRNGQELTAAHEREKELLVQEQKNMHRMVMQSASALASAIDAKDKYTHGHSRRVAEYSEMIAEVYGKTDSECRDIYLAGLLHDVGKIGIPDNIINKDGRLTDEEFAVIKTHPAIGAGILKKINIAPFISIGAHFHHERYDGKGYPEGLKGEDIPEIARIIAVADAYDAMTSKRSYRDALPQEVVRSEIEKGKGTQFDPKFAEIMLGLMDRDTDYQLQQDDVYDV